MTEQRGVSGSLADAGDTDKRILTTELAKTPNPTANATWVYPVVGGHANGCTREVWTWSCINDSALINLLADEMGDVRKATRLVVYLCLSSTLLLSKSFIPFIFPPAGSLSVPWRVKCP